MFIEGHAFSRNGPLHSYPEGAHLHFVKCIYAPTVYIVYIHVRVWETLQNVIKVINHKVKDFIGWWFFPPLFYVVNIFRNNQKRQMP